MEDTYHAPTEVTPPAQVAGDPQPALPIQAPDAPQPTPPTAAEQLLALGVHHYGTILADPPWRFNNRTGKMAPEHKRLARYATLTMDEIMELPVAQLAGPQSHLYLWVPNALIAEGLETMKRWGFTYKTLLPWYKVRKDGGPDGRGVGFYFRNVTETVLFGVRGNLRTGAAGRRQVAIIISRKREHSRKPDELYPIIEACSPGPFLELFARYPQPGWVSWGNEVEPAPPTQAHLPEPEPAIDVQPPRRTRTTGLRVVAGRKGTTPRKRKTS